MLARQEEDLQGDGDPASDRPETPQVQLELQPNRVIRLFTVTMDSYISMCSRVYKALCLRGFGTTVSESVFQYYAVSTLWQHLQKVGYGNVPDDPESQCLCSNKLNFLPSPLDVYVKNIGSYIGPDTCSRQFRMLVSPSNERFGAVTGTFGRVGANTHYLYEAYPAPGIAALRILADLKYTADPCECNFYWDLPTDLCPIEKLSGISTKPTRNLLGWAPAQRLSETQLQFLLDCQISANDFPTECLLHCHNKALLSRVWHALEKIPHRVRYFNNGGSGSIEQGISLERNLNDSHFDKNSMYCEGRMSVSSYHKFNNESALKAMISGYRMPKQSMYEKHCWSCFDFNEYKYVPASWIETKNRVYEWGSVGILNEPLFTTISTDKKIAQNLYIQQAQAIPSLKWNIYD